MVIEQSDRELAAKCAVLDEFRQMIREGCCDDHFMIEAAAQHRITARNQALEEASQEAEKWFPADSAAKYPTGGIAAAIRAMKS